MRENSNLGKVEKYVAEPYLTSRRTNHFEIKTLPPEVQEVVVEGKVYQLK